MRVIMSAVHLNHVNCLATTLARFPNSLAMIKVIVQRHNAKNITVNHSFTPIETAASKQHVEMLRYLVQLGFDVGTTEVVRYVERGDTTRLVALEESGIITHDAIELLVVPYGSVRAVENLLDWGFKISSLACVEAAVRCRHDVIKLLLNAEYKMPWRVMYHAVRLNDLKTVLLLISRKIVITPEEMRDITEVAHDIILEFLAVHGYDTALRAVSDRPV